MKTPQCQIHQRIEMRLMDVVDQYRSMILDPIEQEVGTSPSWKFLRSRILKAMGDRGLSGRIVEVLRSEFQRPEAFGE